MKRLGHAGAVRGSRNGRQSAKRPTRRFRITLTFDLGGIGVSGHRDFVKWADSRSDARWLVGQGRAHQFRLGSRIVPGSRLVVAKIQDTKPC